MTLGEKISAGRKRKGYSQQALAQICEISKRAVASYETDGRLPHPATLRRIAKALGYTVDYLTDDSQDESTLPGPDQLYIRNLRELYGDTTASEIEELLQKSAALFAGVRISQEAKDKYFLALTNAYIACKNASIKNHEDGSHS